MRRIGSMLVAVSLSCLSPTPAFAAAGDTTYEVLVLNSAVTAMVAGNISSTVRRGVFIQNNGPNAIWCALGKSDLAVLNKSVKVAANGGDWTVNSKLPVYCIAASADQVTGAATTVVEVL